MNLLENPHVVPEGDNARLPQLPVGLAATADVIRSWGYHRLFLGKPCYAPVMGLTIFTASEGSVSNVLVGVRDPEENQIHPDVVSTPTMRVPESFVTMVARRARVARALPTQHLFRINGEDWNWRRNDWERDRTGMQLPIDTLLMEKLGVAGDAFRADVVYQFAPHSLTLGDSRAGVTEDGRDVIEKVAMLNVLVDVGEVDMNKFPARTKHYSDIRWIKPEEYRSMQDTKNLLPVFDMDAVNLCIHGVCIATSRNALDDVSNLLASRHD